MKSEISEEIQCLLNKREFRVFLRNKMSEDAKILGGSLVLDIKEPGSTDER